jgi:hypothetical protein
MNMTPQLPLTGAPVANPDAKPDATPKRASVIDEIDFDWSSDDSVIIPEQPAIAVYWNARGNIIIRQEAGWSDDQDCITVIAPANVVSFARRLLTVAGFRGVGLYTSDGGGGCADINDGDIPEGVKGS